MGKKCCTEGLREEGEKCERNNPVDTKVIPAPILEQFMKDCILHAGAGEDCEEEGAAETMHHEPTAASVLQNPALLAGEEEEEEESGTKE